MIAAPLFHQFVQNWLEYLKQQGKSHHTLAAYRRALTHFARWSKQTYRDDFGPAAIIPRDVRDWKAYQQSVEKAAPSTVNQRLAALSRFFAWTVGQEIIQTDPTTNVKMIRLPARQPKGLSRRSLRRLLRMVHQDGKLRDIAILELLAGTGLRVGELLQLQVGDIQIGERSGRVTVRQGKGGNFREVPLTKDVRYALEVYLEGHPGKDGPNASLWLGAQGRLTHRSSVLRILNKYTLRAGLPDMGPHTLRHTFATQYLRANKDDLRGLAALLGHTSLNTLMIYTEPSLEDLTERMERVEVRQEGRLGENEG